MSSEKAPYRRMQVKVLYSFDNSSTVFLSRSKEEFAVKVAQIPVSSNQETQEFLTLGAFDLKSCIEQVVKSSPENFKLNTEDYAVYHKDITEQPEEPFVANGAISSLLSGSKPDLIPGRVCQNLSASFLFGDKASAPSLTLEIRLKFHVTSRSEEVSSPKQYGAESGIGESQTNRKKRVMSSASSEKAIKATRTKSLPIFGHPPSQQISNIINADKLNAAPRYDSKSISERFNSAPFLSARIIDKPSRHRKRFSAPLTPSVGSSLQPQRAIRTRSMVYTTPMISSPINEENLSEATDDTEYNDTHARAVEEEEAEEAEEDEYETHQQDSSSPFTPQQPPYKPSIHRKKSSNSTIVQTDHHQFQSLPDLEDLDSKKTHTIPSSKIPQGHTIICINRNCEAIDSVTWRYFETNFHPNYLNIRRSKPIDMKLFDGMFGPLCNACYLFLRNKGFMRPEAVVKKYLQQQKYKKELKLKEFSSVSDLSRAGAPQRQSQSQSQNQNQSQNHSSPFYPTTQFPTPTHVPSALSEVIRTRNKVSSHHTHGVSKNLSYPKPSVTPDDYQDLNDFMHQLNNFGGPLTDIDLPNDSSHGVFSGTTPPMIATKSNTRVINLCPDDEDKENISPSRYNEFEQMILRSFSQKSSPGENEQHDDEQNEQNDWDQLFGEPTPKDSLGAAQHSNGITPIHEDETLDFPTHPSILREKVSAVVNMPSSPLLTHDLGDHVDQNLVDDSSPLDKARRTDTTMSYVQGRVSSPQSDVGENINKVELIGISEEVAESA